MFKSEEGSARRLLELCWAYFVFYVITGVSVKYFLGPADHGFPGMSDLEFLTWSTLGGSLICLIVVFVRKWYRLESVKKIRLLGLAFPAEYLYIIPSGICTAVIIPTTTLMYTLPVSVMVAMVIMRGSVIVISRIVDAILIRQGILKKKVFFEENVAVGFALAAIGVHLVGASNGSFDFIASAAAMAILLSYIAAYAVRIYIMNYYKNTHETLSKESNKSFFAIEQIAASGTLLVVSLAILWVPSFFGIADLSQVKTFQAAVRSPDPLWSWAILAGVAYGMVAFFSVFLFMFKGRTATFTGLVNRLTSLVAGTTATLLSFWFFSSKFPSLSDWGSLGFILVAVGFLSLAEKRRSVSDAAPMPQWLSWLAPGARS